jgi:organic hydroperoxide reductase OsmC/OhrA
MSIYTAKIHWANAGDGSLSNSYSRAHAWTFDGGLTVAASSSPQIVPEPLSVTANVDPEEAFVASISSCHMLWFLSLAAKLGVSIHSYTENAVGTMGSNSKRQLAMLKVELNPQVTLADGTTLDANTAAKLHKQAHERCFIASSVTTEILVNTGSET